MARFNGLKKGTQTIVRTTGSLAFGIVDGLIDGLVDVAKESKETTTGKALVKFFSDEEKKD